MGPSNEARIIYPDLGTCKGYIHGARRWCGSAAGMLRACGGHSECGMRGVALASGPHRHSAAPLQCRGPALLRPSSPPILAVVDTSLLPHQPWLSPNFRFRATSPLCSGGHPAAAPHPRTAGRWHPAAPARRRPRWGRPAQRRRWQRQLCAHWPAVPVDTRVFSLGTHGQQQRCAGARQQQGAGWAGAWLRASCSLLQRLPHMGAFAGCARAAGARLPLRGQQ